MQLLLLLSPAVVTERDGQDSDKTRVSKLSEMKEEKIKRPLEWFRKVENIYIKGVKL